MVHRGAVEEGAARGLTARWNTDARKRRVAPLPAQCNAIVRHRAPPLNWAVGRCERLRIKATVEGDDP